MRSRTEGPGDPKRGRRATRRSGRTCQLNCAGRARQRRELVAAAPGPNRQGSSPPYRPPAGRVRPAAGGPRSMMGAGPTPSCCAFVPLRACVLMERPAGVEPSPSVWKS
jgi:hypothetical protein